MNLKSTLESNGLCNICGSTTRMLGRPQTNSTVSSTDWETETLMKLLSLNEVNTSFRFCNTCSHIFRFPLYDEAIVYSQAGDEMRRTVYKEYFPGKDFNKPDQFDTARDTFIKSERIYTQARKIVRAIRRNLPEKSGIARILDFGGGDGAFLELILTSLEMARREVAGYVYDASPWNRDKPPGFHLLNDLESMVETGPYDIIFANQILEHVKDPLSILRCLKSCTGENGLVLVEVPFETLALRHASTGMSHHQNIFTPKSLARSISNSGLKPVSVNTKLLDSYRGTPIMIIQAICTNGDFGKNTDNHSGTAVIHLARCLLQASIGAVLNAVRLRLNV